MNIFKKWLYGKSKEKCQHEADDIVKRNTTNEL